jgi:Cu(I)/Ag(I) efflux system membrane protein CusA/SilA
MSEATKTKNDIITEINNKLQIPGVTNGFTQPIINRINMLVNGYKNRCRDKNLRGKFRYHRCLISKNKESTWRVLDGVKDLYSEPITGGKYIDIQPKREVIGRYGLTIDDINNVVEASIGGMKLTTTIEGRQRFSVNARYAQEYRNSIEALKKLQVQTMQFGPIPLESVADIKISDGPPMINSENAMLRGSVLFNVRDRDLGSTVKDAQKKLNAMIAKMPKGYYVEWSGQWENQLRANKTLKLIMPIVVLIIFLILFFTYGSMKEAIITMITVPFALIGGIFMVYFYGINLSVAVAVGFIAYVRYGNRDSHANDYLSQRGNE